MIVCRNLLIYLNAEAQQRVLPMFHYALRSGGLLFLGASETVGTSVELFDAVDSSSKIYRRKEIAGFTQPSMPLPAPHFHGEEHVNSPLPTAGGRTMQQMLRSIERMLLDRFAPCSVVVDERWNVVYLHGRDSGRYFQPEQGQPRNNILEMAREGLAAVLAKTLRDTTDTGQEITLRDVRTKMNGAIAHVNLTVKPLNTIHTLKGLTLVSIVPSGEEQTGRAVIVPDRGSTTEGHMDLERELQYTRDHLKTTVEALESSNEELKDTNEELQSANEELLSSNEELETSKEEMQSLNEELNTVNAELQSEVDVQSPLSQTLTLDVDGKRLWIDISVVYYPSDDQCEAGYRVTMSDVSERVAVEAQLRANELHLRELSRTLEQRVAERTGELEALTSRLRRMATELASVEQRERKRLAAILHDDLQQILFAADLHLDQVNCGENMDDVSTHSFAMVKQLLKQATDVSRHLAHRLRPPTLYEDGLISALHWMAREMNRQHKLHVDIQANTNSGQWLNDDLKAMLFDFVYELLFNVVRHAQADRASVAMIDADRRLRLIVRDDGVGFDPGELLQDAKLKAWGLFSIRERLVSLGGSLDIQSMPQPGTCVMLVIPRSQNDDEMPGVAIESADQIDVKTEDTTKCTRVLVVDDHAIVRQGIINILKEDSRLQVAGAAADGIEAVEAVCKYHPNVVLMDLNMPRMNGIEATQEICRRWPQTIVIGLSVQDDQNTAESMIKAGASAFESKSGDCHRLIGKIVDLHEHSISAA